MSCRNAFVWKSAEAAPNTWIGSVKALVRQPIRATQFSFFFIGGRMVGPDDGRVDLLWLRQDDGCFNLTFGYCPILSEEPFDSLWNLISSQKDRHGSSTQPWGVSNRPPRSFGRRGQLA